MTESFNLVLKQATEALHRSVEANPISKAIMSPQLSPAVYAEYLQRSFLIHEGVETTVFPVVRPIVNDVEARIKTTSILEDLLQLGKKQKPSGAMLLDEHYRNSPAFNLGLMYVTEGSVLGGQYILKNIKKTLGEEAPGAFLNVYGEKTGSTWKQFLEALNAFAEKASEVEKQEIIDGALYGFKQVGHVLSRPMPQESGLL